MEEINKSRIARNTIMLYIRMILIMFVSLYTSRIILECLGVVDFGIYNVVGGIVLMFGFLNSAMSVATQRFLSFEIGKKDHRRLQTVFSTSVSIHLIISLIIFILSETIGLWFLNNKMNIDPNRLGAANWVFQCSLLSLFVTIMSVPYNALIIAREQMSAFAYISVIEVSLKLISAFLLFVLNGDKLVLYSILTLFTSVFIRIIYQLYSRIKFPESKFVFVYDKCLMRDLLAFSGWSLFGGIAYIVKNQGVNIVLNLFFGTIINAAWSIAQQVNSALISLITNFTTAINPPITKAYARNDLENTYLLLFSGIKYSFFLSLCLIVPFYVNCSFILRIWLENIPPNSVLFTQLTLLVLLIESLVHPISAAVQATGRIKIYQTIIGITLFLNLPLSYLFLKLGYGYLYVFYIAIFLSVFAVIARFVILYKLIGYTLQMILNLSRIVLSMVLVNILTCYFLYNFTASVIMLVLSCTVVIIINCVGFYIIGLEGEERIFVNKKIFNVIKRIRA